GNIHLLLAAAIVVGFRYPGAWAWVFLTKVTPGIGVLWFAMRREWRKMGAALGMTTAMVAVSFVLTPDLWLRWFEVLTGSVDVTRPSVLEIPVLPRLAVAALVITIGAWRGWPATVPVAATLALPAVWVNSLAMLVAVVPLWRKPPHRMRAAQPTTPSAATGAE
ncbi:MAG: glycosyltransferase 87 family protein, partial [Candidatus Limnocylindria bacterium]